ncbi:hypothetical protein KIW84_032280 [Lathyrus oleraceus]|uniref:Retroviral polymerase SH3-like domain-containing protein n=1 Tax=Pisum sativum TaxID=3888 RepID=A0A9D4XX36_PEA|nr:hypothetical protein KIW84_032280 [Pisum sativum]
MVSVKATDPGYAMTKPPSSPSTHLSDVPVSEVSKSLDDLTRFEFTLKIAHKLDEKNFHLWHQQIEPCINTHNLAEFVVCSRLRYEVTPVVSVIESKFCLMDIDEVEILLLAHELCLTKFKKQSPPDLVSLNLTHAEVQEVVTQVVAEVVGSPLCSVRPPAANITLLQLTVPSAFVANSQQSASPSSSWYPNSGASYHVTNDLRNLQQASHEVLLDGVTGTDGLYEFSSINLSNSNPKTALSTMSSCSLFPSVNSTFVSASPTSMWHFRPDYAFLRVFGCARFPLLRPYTSHKLDFRSQSFIFLGYSISHKGYKFLAPSGRLYVSKDMLFNESRFPYVELFQSPTPTVTHKSSFVVSLSPLPCFTHSHSDSTPSPSSTSTHNVSSNPTTGANNPSESHNHAKISSTSHTESLSTSITPSDRGSSSEVVPSSPTPPFVSPGPGST